MSDPRPNIARRAAAEGLAAFAYLDGQPAELGATLPSVGAGRQEMC